MSGQRAFLNPCLLKCVALAVETYSEYESIASESEEPSLEEVRKAGRKVTGAKKSNGNEKTLKSLEEESVVMSPQRETKPSSGSASKKEVPKEEERKSAFAPATKPLPKAGKNIHAGKNGQKTLNSFFEKK